MIAGEYRCYQYVTKKKHCAGDDKKRSIKYDERNRTRDNQVIHNLRPSYEIPGKHFIVEPLNVLVCLSHGREPCIHLCNGKIAGEIQPVLAL